MKSACWRTVALILCALAFTTSPAVADDAGGDKRGGGNEQAAQPSDPTDGGYPLNVVGACCMENGMCIEQTRGECLLALGFFQGPSTDCTTVDCAGACCLLDGTCQDLGAMACAAAGGSYQGYDSDCACVECGSGACCRPQNPSGFICNDGVNRTTCEALGGLYIGESVTCGGFECEFDEGTFSGESSPYSESIELNQFDEQGGLRKLKKVIFYLQSEWSFVAYVENEATKNGQSGIFLTPQLTQASEFPCPEMGVCDPVMTISLPLEEMINIPDLAPRDDDPLAGPDFYDIGHRGYCASDIRQVEDETEFGPFLGAGVTYARYNASTFFIQGFPTEIDFQLADSNFQGIVKVVYIFERTACCLCTGECINGLTQAECESQGGAFTQGDLCAADGGTVDCEPLGACCNCDGTCFITTPSNCVGEGDVYLGDCTDCSTCEATGACCNCDGTCTITTEAECTGEGNIYLGDCSDCSTCEPRGACCNCDGSCFVTTRSNCVGEGDVYLGDCTDCSGCEATGACCNCDGTCTITTEAECTGEGNTYLGDCSTCDECEATGACCNCDGTCTITTEAECTGEGNVYLGDCSTCDACEATGACCNCDGTCTITTEADCLAGAGNVYLGDCSTCDTCVATGACCRCDGTCTIETEADCIALGPDYTYLGDCSTCDQCEPEGVCCYTDGTCQEGVRESDCLSDPNFRDFIPCETCDDNPCALGACCLSDLTCQADVTESECFNDLGGVSWTDGATCDEVVCDANCRIQCGEKGSLIIFSKVEVRFDSSGEVIGDTIITMSNDYPQDVDVQFFFVNGDDPIPAEGAEPAHPGWNFFDVKMTFTGNQPRTWRASDGSGLVPPWDALDPGGRPVEGSTDRVVRGFIYGWAVDSFCREIKWNHLSGHATLVRYDVAANSAWEYNACTSQVRIAVDDEPGCLNLNGLEYCSAPSHLLSNFFAVGSSDPFTGVGNINTAVALLPVSQDLRLDVPTSPVATKAQYDVWNEFEVKLSGAYQCLTCWDCEAFSNYPSPNHFTIENLMTNVGKFRINGISSPVCDLDGNPSQMAAMLGLRIHKMGLNSSVTVNAMAGTNMIGMGLEDAIIKYDPLGDPPPVAPDGIESPFEEADHFIAELQRLAEERGPISGN